MQFRHCTQSQMQMALDAINPLYNGNLVFGDILPRGRIIRATLRTRDSNAHGARRSASGRRIRSASWEAHRDFMMALFDINPDTVIVSALATYRGKDDFLSKYPTTASYNAGTQMCPVAFADLTV